MKTFLVVTITCPDRPGVVERITQVVFGESANWEDSRMARLGGEFAGIIKLSAEEDRVDRLVEALEQLADDETRVAVRRTSEPSSAGASPQLVTLSLSGADHEGIVHRVSALLASNKVNVESMETSVVPAPVTASPLFQMVARVLIPAGVDATVLNRDLSQLAESLGVDIELGAFSGDDPTG